MDDSINKYHRHYLICSANVELHAKTDRPFAR